MPYSYHTSGKRAYILDEEGATVCEIVPPFPNNRAALAATLVDKLNRVDALTAALNDLALAESLPKGFANRDVLISRAKALTLV